MRLHVVHQDFSRDVKVYITEGGDFPGAEKMTFFRFTDRGLMLGNIVNVEEIEKDGLIVEPPAMIIRTDMFNRMVAAFQQYAKDKHLPMPTESYTQGQLEAMKEHLSDMRKLVFKGAK